MRRTIMTVDDSPSMRALLRRALDGDEYQVMEAEDGVDALERIEGADPDLLITDINMPRMDGFQLIETIRSNPDVYGNIPVLVLTTEFSDQKKQRARDAGATGWIVKPFDPDKLKSAIRRVLL